MLTSSKIPDRFNSLNEYASTWSAAVREEMNIKLAAVAKQFHDCYAAIKKPEDGVCSLFHVLIIRLIVILEIGFAKAAPTNVSQS